MCMCVSFSRLDQHAHHVIGGYASLLGLILNKCVLARIKSAEDVIDPDVMVGFGKEVTGYDENAFGVVGIFYILYRRTHR